MKSDLLFLAEDIKEPPLEKIPGSTGVATYVARGGMPPLRTAG